MVVDGVTVTEYTLLDLVPRTRYLISVVAMNAVSDLVDSLADSTATIPVTTLPSGKFLELHTASCNVTSCSVP